MGRRKGSKNKVKSQGLGDTVEKITKATGIDKVVKAVAGNSCGCEERRKKLNKLVSYKLKVKECLTDEQIQWFTDYQSRKTLTVAKEDVNKLEDIYNHLFGLSYEVCRGCSSAGKQLIKIIDIIQKVYDES